MDQQPLSEEHSGLVGQAQASQEGNSDLAFLLTLEPVPMSQIPQKYLEKPLPFAVQSKLNLMAHKTARYKQKQGVKVKAIKKGSVQPKPNKNEGLREEQARLAMQFRENILVKKTSEGNQFYTCKLCKVNGHRFIILCLV